FYLSASIPTRGGTRKDSTAGNEERAAWSDSPRARLGRLHKLRRRLVAGACGGRRRGTIRTAPRRCLGRLGDLDPRNELEDIREHVHSPSEQLHSSLAGAGKNSPISGRSGARMYAS